MAYPYTVLAYLEEGIQSCRGCVTDSWGSDFEWGQFEEFDQALEWAKTIVNKSERHEFSGYDITLLHVSGHEEHWPNANSGDRFTAYLNAYAIDVRNKIKQEKEDAIAERERRDAEYRKQRDLAELERLTKQYGSVA